MNGHVQNISNGFPVQCVGQYLVLKAFPAAHFARKLDPLKEAEVSVGDTESLTVRAGALGVKAKQTSVNVVDCREGLAHLIHNAGIGSGIGATGSAQG